MVYIKKEPTHCKKCGLPFTEDNPRGQFAPNQYRLICRECLNEERRVYGNKSYHDTRADTLRKQRYQEVMDNHPRLMRAVMSGWKGKGDETQE